MVDDMDRHAERADREYEEVLREWKELYKSHPFLAYTSLSPDEVPSREQVEEVLKKYTTMLNQIEDAWNFITNHPY